MTTHTLLREIDLPRDQIEREIDQTFSQMEDWLPPEDHPFRENSLVKGHVVRVTPDGVWVDLGCKSEGVLPLSEWFDENLDRIVLPQVGDEISLLLQSIEDDSGTVVVSHRRARLHARWEEFLASHRVGESVTGVVTRKVKGGLLVAAGVNLFLPAGQVDIRRPRDLGDFLGTTVECKILEIDRARHSAVVSRRQFLEERRAELKQSLLASLESGQVRKGVVKNVTSFGAFVDLGGMDGLLHVHDMSWGRVSDPHSVVHVDQELDVLVLRVDRESERISLSLKHLMPSPWGLAAEQFPVGSSHEGVVANLATFGAFVELAPGLEGLVHVSQMGRGRSLKQLQRGDRVACVVLDIDTERQRLSLGLAGSNPWEGAAQRFQVGEVLAGTVTKLTSFGAFVELEPGLEGLLHVSEVPDRRLPEDLQVGDEIHVKVVRVDEGTRKIGLSLRGLEGTEE